MQKNKLPFGRRALKNLNYSIAKACLENKEEVEQIFQTVVKNYLNSERQEAN